MVIGIESTLLLDDIAVERCLTSSFSVDISPFTICISRSWKLLSLIPASPSLSHPTTSLPASTIPSAFLFRCPVSAAVKWTPSALRRHLFISRKYKKGNLSIKKKKTHQQIAFEFLLEHYSPKSRRRLHRESPDASVSHGESQASCASEGGMLGASFASDAGFALWFDLKKSRSNHSKKKKTGVSTSFQPKERNFFLQVFRGKM